MSRQEKYDTIQKAISKLNAVHTEMMELVLAGELESKDFEQINALYDQLNEKAEEYTPGYHVVTWAEFLATCQKAG